MQDLFELISNEHYLIKYYDKQLESIAYNNGITKIDLDILLYIYNHPTKNTAKDVVNYRYIAKSFVSKSISFLSKNNYIELLEDVNDRRIIRINILEKSSNAINEGKKLQRHLSDVIQSSLSEEDIKQLIITINKIKTSLQREEL